MELCDKNLSQLLIEKRNNNKLFDIKEIIEILMQLNNSLRIMKENKIIHRDLKLENILIKYKDKEKNNYIIKLADYGNSKRLDSLSKNYCNSNVGTLIYMAPEILKKEKYNYKCDLWSIGIIIYRLIFGVAPYFGETEIALINNINKFENKLLKSTGNEKLDNLIKNLLEKTPEKRLSWDKYLNHPFFVDHIKLNLKDEGKKKRELIKNRKKSGTKIESMKKDIFREDINIGKIFFSKKKKSQYSNINNIINNTAKNYLNQKKEVLQIHKILRTYINNKNDKNITETIKSKINVNLNENSLDSFFRIFEGVK